MRKKPGFYKSFICTSGGITEVKRAFLFASYTSPGLAEIRELKWPNINKGRLITYRKKTGELINNRLNKTALAILGESGKKDDSIFVLQKLSNNGANQAIRNWVKWAKINKHFTFYCARHTYACQLLSNGVNLKTIADAIGHSSTKSTLKYLNSVQRFQDGAINNLLSIKIEFFPIVNIIFPLRNPSIYIRKLKGSQ